jgi:hypothetical protein
MPAVTPGVPLRESDRPRTGVSRLLLSRIAGADRAPRGALGSRPVRKPAPASAGLSLSDLDAGCDRHDGGPEGRRLFDDATSAHDRSGSLLLGADSKRASALADQRMLLLNVRSHGSHAPLCRIRQRGPVRVDRRCAIRQSYVSAALVGVVDRGFHQQRCVTSDVPQMVACSPAARGGCARSEE